MSRVIDAARAIQRGEMQPPGVAKLLNMRFVDVEVGRISMEQDVDERMANPMGTLHGGILCDLGDAAMGLAFASTCEDDESYATIELTCNFLRPVWKTRLRANAHVVHRGHTIGLTECEILDEHQRLIAKLSSTLIVLRGDAAKGR